MRVENDDGKLRGVYDIKINPMVLRVKTDDETLYILKQDTFWRDVDTGKSYSTREMLQRVFSNSNVKIVPSYTLPNDMFFDDDEKLYYQENFVKSRDPDFDDPNRYMNFQAFNDMTSDFDLSYVNPTKRTIAHKFELNYRLK